MARRGVPSRRSSWRVGRRGRCRSRKPCTCRGLVPIVDSVFQRHASAPSRDTHAAREDNASDVISATEPFGEVLVCGAAFSNAGGASIEVTAWRGSGRRSSVLLWLSGVRLLLRVVRSGSGRLLRGVVRSGSGRLLRGVVRSGRISLLLRRGVVLWRRRGVLLLRRWGVSGKRGSEALLHAGLEVL